MKKTILFIMATLLFSVSAEAIEVYSFSVENPTMGRAYFDIFNSISALMQNQAYGEMLKLVFTLGGFFVFVLGVFKVLQGQDGKGALSDFAKYIIASTMLMLMVLPDPSRRDQTMAQLKVESRVLPAYYCSNAQIRNGTVVDSSNYSGYTVEMPWVLAWSFSAINRIGKTTTDLAASAFSSVSTDSSVASSFQENSLSGFGSGIESLQILMGVDMKKVYNSGNGSITSTTFGSIKKDSVIGDYFTVFMQQCIFMYKSVNQGVGAQMTSALDKTSDFHATLDDMFQSDKIVIYKSVFDATNKEEITLDPALNPKPGDLFITITDNDGNKVTGSCADYEKQVFSPMLTGINTDQIMCEKGIAQSVTPAGIYLLTGDDGNVGAPQASKLVVNSGLINMYKESKDGSRIASDISYSSGKTSAEFILNSAGTGYYMAKMIPYLQMGIRAVLYAFFPFVFLVMLLPGGFSVIKSYLQSMVWVELWSPVAAILNLFLSYFQMDRISGIYQNQGLGATQVSSIISDASMLASVGGYLYASVPALTWLILKGSAQMLGGISSGMAAGFSKNLNSAAINQDMAEVKKTKEFNDNNTTGKFLDMAEVQHMETQGAAAAEGAHISALNNLAHEKGMNYSALKSLQGLGLAAQDAEIIGKGQNVARDPKALSTAVDMGDLSNEKRLAQIRTEMRSKGILRADGTVDKEKLDQYGAEVGTAKAKGDLAAAQLMEMTARNAGLDLSTEKGRADTATLVAKNVANNDFGKFSGEVEYQRQYEMSHDQGGGVGMIREYDKNGKETGEWVHASKANVGSVIESGGQAMKESGQTEAGKKIREEWIEQSKQNKTGQQSNAINSLSDMKKSFGPGAKNMQFKEVVNEKTGAKSYMAMDSEGHVFQAQNGQFVRQANASADQTGAKAEDRKEAFKEMGSVNGNDLGLRMSTGNIATVAKNEAYKFERDQVETSKTRAVISAAKAGDMQALQKMKGYGETKGYAQGLEGSLKKMKADLMIQKDNGSLTEEGQKTLDKINSFQGQIVGKNGNVDLNKLMGATAMISKLSTSNSGLAARGQDELQKAKINAHISTKNEAEIATSETKAKIKKGTAAANIIEGEDGKDINIGTDSEGNDISAKTDMRNNMINNMEEHGHILTEDEKKTVREGSTEEYTQMLESKGMSKESVDFERSLAASQTSAKLEGKTAAFNSLKDTNKIKQLHDAGYNSKDLANTETYNATQQNTMAELATNIFGGGNFAQGGTVMGNIKAVSETGKMILMSKALTNMGFEMKDGVLKGGKNLMKTVKEKYKNKGGMKAFMRDLTVATASVAAAGTVGVEITEELKNPEDSHGTDTDKSKHKVGTNRAG